VQEIISNELWNEIKDLIPMKKVRTVGRPRANSRKMLNGIFWIIRTGAQWSNLPRVFGAPTTVHGWFNKWARTGIFELIQEKAYSFYKKNNNPCDSWFAIDTSFSKAPFARNGGRNPTDRGKRGMKRSIIVDWYGAPVACEVGAANKHDVRLFRATAQKIFNSKNNLGEIRILAADSAFDSKQLREFCQKNETVLFAAKNPRKTGKRPNSPGHRWVVERTFGWMSWYRGLKTCWSKKSENFLASTCFAAAIQLFKMGGIFG